MGKHSTPLPLRVRSVVAAAVIGMGTVLTAGTAQADGPSPESTAPCVGAVRACVDLDSSQAWLMEDGEVVRGPVSISSGGPGKETPRGEFTVEWKNANHRSKEFNDAPMPFAVFFAEGGIAFHEGNLETASAGCVRLSYDDAAAFYDYLSVGDPVEVR